MRKKTIEALEPKKLPKDYKSKWGTTVQQAGDIVIFNAYQKEYLVGRHCIDSKTGEYATWVNKNSPIMKDYAMSGKEPIWTGRMVSFLYCPNQWTAYYHFDSKKYDEITYIPEKKDRELVKKIFKLSKNDNKQETWNSYTITGWRREIERRESSYSAKSRRETEDRRLGRVQDEMDKVPDIPADFDKWCYNFMFGGIPGTASYHATTKLWYCSECHEESERDSFKYEDGSRAKTNAVGLCPVCGARVKIGRKTKKYTPVIQYSNKAVIFNDIDENMSVARYFDIIARTDPEGLNIPAKGKWMSVSETIRIVLYKDIDPAKVGELVKGRKVRACRIYYRDFYGNFDWKSNPQQRHTGECMCYPNGEITAALRGTVYYNWARPFESFARMGQIIDYNRCMVAYQGKEANIVEMLVKGRFYKLSEEYIDTISLWDGRKYGNTVLNEYGKNANEVFMLKDTQAVNRLRDMNGDSYVLKWLQWTEKEKKKISQQALVFFTNNKMLPANIKFIYPKMSPEQIMNYMIRQQQGSCKGMPIHKSSYYYSYSSNNSGILERWQDYLQMAKDLNKKLDDEMIYRPGDLAERHKEYTEECNKKRAIIQAKRDKEAARRQAEEYRKKFPTAAAILKDIKPKFEFSNDEYMIIVPKALTEIIFEGNQLHHCAGATDRYFDRIVQRETYICFLRKTKKPKQPFYTIEVEPGGTIRQHRGMYDEEPNIEQIKPFLRLWQKEIRKRMKEEDKAAAEISKIKRAENIKELEAKGNLRVLKGLMEDFMDIEEEEAEQKASKKKKTVKKTA